MNIWVKWYVQSKEQMPACSFSSLQSECQCWTVKCAFILVMKGLCTATQLSHPSLIDILFSLTQSDWCAQSPEEELLLSLFCLYFTNTRVINSAKFLASTSVFLLHTSKGTILLRFPIKAVFLIKALCLNIEPFFKVTLLIYSGHHVGTKEQNHVSLLNI